MGKTVTSYPPARGENNLENIKEAALPLKVYLWAAYVRGGVGEAAGSLHPS